MVSIVTSRGAAHLLDTPVFSDKRGFFTENWNDNWKKELNLDFDVKQTNACWTEKANTLRGMHAQYGYGSMAKLVRCIRGQILDVVIDAREGSATYGGWSAFHLRGPEQSVFVPRGYYHGYVTLTDDVVVLYNQDNTHSSALECGLNFNSNPDFWAEQGINTKNLIISDRDLLQPDWDEAIKFPL